MAGLARSDGSWFGCGGTLVAQEWVVTAAHCFDRATPTHIFLGEHKLSDTTESDKFKLIAVTKSIKHEGYTVGGFKEDIALMKLAEKVDLNTYTPACLATTGSTYVDKIATAYGWGETDYGQSTSDILLEVDLKVVNRATCSAAMGANAILDGMLCAGGEAGKDGCGGDSGGPLTVPDATTKQHTLIGATSWGNKCALAGQYGVWADIAFYRAWMDAKFSDNGGATFTP